MTDDPEYVRLDKWLWSVRVFKTRADATEACRGSAIKVNEQSAKPATKIRIGDTLKIRKRGITLTLKVKGLIEKRVGAQKVEEFCTDETSPAERILQQERQINAKLYKNHTLMKELKLKSIELLKKLIQTESFSTKEDKTAELIQKWFKKNNIVSQRFNKNIYAFNKYSDPEKQKKVKTKDYANGVIFTINGQSNGNLQTRFFSQKGLKFENISI